ncbi:hypothetical protein [Streptomyces sp. AS02]|uniref:hypothetical protein n=1 Tax=Streptomyces sp. AS02 TaxID=2938946 RepID=UPI0020215825|nr:hypothetical protein [Streptomyces sp. AS02]MCL8016884.1 hypothetical protein [Streptomyces sp. AS02]
MTDTPHPHAAPADIQAAADRLENLAAAVPLTDRYGQQEWRRAGYGDYGPAVYLGESTVEVEDSEGGQALAAYLEVLHPDLVRALAVLLREADHGGSPAAAEVARLVPASEKPETA